MQLPLHRRVAAANRFDGLQRTTVAPRASSRPDRGVEQHALDLGPLAKALTAAAVAVSLVGRAGAAHADAAWKPRRHHRHVGERFTDTWADAIVEEQEATKEAIRDLQKLLQQEKRRADDEASKRQAAEQRARSVSLQQSTRSAYDEDALLSIRVLGADITGPLTFGLLLAGGWQAYRTDLLGQLTGRRRGRKGRWVYDRGLGGKRVWVPAESEEGGSGKLPDHMSDVDFSALAAVAATKAAAGSGGGAQQVAAHYEPPAWWERPGFLPVTSEADRARRRAEAERILRRIEASKNRGEDYALEDILALRAACMSAGGASLDARTVGGRDAIYRTAVEAGIKSCLEPGSVDLGDYSPIRLAAGVASDVSLDERRAVTVLKGLVAGACRGRIVEALASLEKGDDLATLVALTQLGSLLEGLPVLEGGSTEVALVAEELNSWAPVAAREKLLLMMVQIDEEKVDLLARLMQLRPEEAMPRIRAQLDATGGVGV